jgi:hypothetical protein
VLQKWGTEVARKSWHNDTWIASLENKLNRAHNDIVITDVRFPNEIKAVRNAGGIVIRVVRGPEPEWYELAIETNSGTFNHMAHAYPEVHPSEWAWIGTKFDAIIDNNADGLDPLFAQVKDLVLSLRTARVNQF